MEKRGTWSSADRDLLDSLSFWGAANRQSRQGARTERGSGVPKEASPYRDLSPKRSQVHNVYHTISLSGGPVHLSNRTIIAGIKLSGPPFVPSQRVPPCGRFKKKKRVACPPIGDPYFSEICS
jgi:hypothetical protein